MGHTSFFPSRITRPCTCGILDATTRLKDERWSEARETVTVMIVPVEGE